MQSGTAAEVARALLEQLGDSAGPIGRALVRTAAAAVAAGVVREDVAQWSRLPTREPVELLAVRQGGG
ncbi:hypothetical protein ACFW9F_01340 [Streptomyces sp. NPDC059506]|uniref:hypothetical protein n=1 Tax=Streptomyces sp. NPDC059506 TaxID=3347751 RepID=UPI0036B6BB6E